MPLTTPQKAARITADESAQLKRVLDLLHERFAEPIRMRHLCAAGNISERSLHRLFVRHLRPKRRINLEPVVGIESGRVGEKSIADRSFSFVRFRARGRHLETEFGGARRPVTFIAKGRSILVI